MLLSTAIVVGHMLVAPKFCDGIRTAETQTGMTYREWYAEYALDLDSQRNIEKIESANASAAGLPNFHEIGIKARETAKAKRAKINGTYARMGQAVVCGKTSDNWND